MTYLSPAAIVINSSSSPKMVEKMSSLPIERSTGSADSTAPSGNTSSSNKDSQKSVAYHTKYAKVMI